MNYDDMAGRILAHAFHDELDKIASSGREQAIAAAERSKRMAVLGGQKATRAAKFQQRAAGWKAQSAAMKRPAPTPAPRPATPSVGTPSKPGMTGAAMQSKFRKDLYGPAKTPAFGSAKPATPKPATPKPAAPAGPAAPTAIASATPSKAQIQAAELRKYLASR